MPDGFWTPTVVHLLVFSVGAGGAGATVAWSLANRGKQAAEEYALFAGVVALWNVLVGAAVLAGEPLQYPLVVVIDLVRYGMAVTFLWFALTYTGYRERLTPGIRATLGSVTVVVVGLLVTDPLLGLYYAEVRTVASPFAVGEAELSAFGAVGTVYGFALTSLGTLALLHRFAATRYAREWKAPFLVFTLLGAVAADFAAQFPVPGVVPGVDYAAPVTAANAALYVLVLYRYDAFGFTPIARESIVSNLDDAIVVLDPRHRVVDYNEAAAEAFDFEGAIGDRARAALPEAVADTDLVREGTPGSTEVSILRDGRRVHYDVNVSAIENVEGRSGLVVTLRDVTELTESKEALERQNERLDAFAGTVAHDLRNPLAVARTFVGDLDREMDDPRPAEANEALDRMDAMIDDLLDLARQGETVEDPESVSLSEAAALAWDVSDTREATLEIVDDRVVRADPDRLGNLFENLFRNAVEHGSTASRAEADAAGGTDAAPTGESITVYVEPTDEGFAVEDTGPGIDPEKRSEVFEEGYTTREDGTGFGLSIVKSIAQAHGWDVRATEGDREGGARFEFRL